MVTVKLKRIQTRSEILHGNLHFEIPLAKNEDLTRI